MTIAKAKLAGAVALAAIALAVVSGICAKVLPGFRSVQSAMTAPASSAEAADQPAIDTSEFEQACALAPGEAVKIIPPPYPPGRMEFFMAQEPTDARMQPRGPDSLGIRSTHGKLQIWRKGYGTRNRGIVDLLEPLLNQYPQDMEMDRTLARQKVLGDFVVDANASRDQIRLGLQKAISETTGVPITLTFRNVDHSVVVISGACQVYTPVDSKQAADTLEIYGRDLDKNRNQGGASGDAIYFSKMLGQWINEPVVIEATGFPDMMHFNVNDSGDGSADSKAHARDADLVLQHICDQTGLTFKREVRNIPRLFVERGK